MLLQLKKMIYPPQLSKLPVDAEGMVCWGGLEFSRARDIVGPLAPELTSILTTHGIIDFPSFPAATC
jgi:hypothetical protein